AIEHAPAHRRGFYGSWPQMGVAIGLLLSTLVFRHFSGYPEATFMAWAWRVPFLLSFILLVVGLWIRHRLAESPVFEALKRRGAEARMPVIEVFRRHAKSVLLATACSLFTVPAWGAISDRVGRRPVYLLGAVAGGILAFPFFSLLDTGRPALIWLALVLSMAL